MANVLVGGVDIDQVQDPVADQQPDGTNTIACVTTVDCSRPDSAPYPISSTATVGDHSRSYSLRGSDPRCRSTAQTAGLRRPKTSSACGLAGDPASPARGERCGPPQTARPQSPAWGDAVSSMPTDHVAMWAVSRRPPSARVSPTADRYARKGTRPVPIPIVGMAAGPDKADPTKVQRLGHAPAVRSLRGQWLDDRGCGRRTGRSQDADTVRRDRRPPTDDPVSGGTAR